MATPHPPRGSDDLERGANDVLEAMRLAGRLLRALAPIAVEMRELQGALGQLQEATQWQQLPAGDHQVSVKPLGPGTQPDPMPAVAAPPAAVTAVPEPAPRETPARPNRANQTAREAAIGQPESPPPVPPKATPPVPDQRPAAGPRPVEATQTLPATPPPPSPVRAVPPVTVSQPAAPLAESLPPVLDAVPPAGGRVETPARSTEPVAAAARPIPTARRRTVSVTVTRTEGPLDLVRVHGALDGLPGVTGLALASYTRGRANILLDTDRAPDDLAVAEALRSAFPEGVSGEWMGDTEFVATIGAASKSA